MKILFVLEHFDPYIGGVEKLFKVLSFQLVEKGFDVRVITTRFDKTLPLREDINGVDVVRLPMSNRFLFTFFGFFYGYRYSKSFDLIHTTSYNAALPAILMGLFRRKKTIITFHEVWGKLWFQLPWLNIVARILFFLYEQFVLRLPFAHFIAVSDFTKNALLEYKKEQNVSRIYNGLEYKDGITSDRGNSYLFFGRLGVSKGIDLLLGACSLLIQRQVLFSLTMVIPRIPKAFYKRVVAQIESEGLANCISLKHHLSDQELQQEILSAKAVIIPSYSEGFCFAAAEVCAAGVPLIHSGQGALPEVVSGKTIAMDQLSAAALANAIEMAESGQWTKSDFKKFPLRDTVDQYTELYQCLL